MGKVCSVCGNIIPGNNAFCTVCGAPADQQAAQPAGAADKRGFCQRCGAPLDAAGRFCTVCGAPAETAAPVQQAAAQASAPRPAPAQAPVFRQNQATVYNTPPVMTGRDDPAPGKTGRWAPMSALNIVGALLIMSIPIVGWVFAIVWACGGCKKKQKASLARAVLILFLIAALLSFLTSLALKSLWNKAVAEDETGLLAAFSSAFSGGEFDLSGAAGLAGLAGQDGGSGGGAGLSSPVAGQFSGHASSDYLNMMTGSYYMEFKANAMGIEMEGWQAGDGQNSATEASVWGMVTHTITSGDTTYTLYDEQKIYTAVTLTPGETAAAAGMIDVDYASVEYYDSGAEEASDGVMCDWDEYRSEITSDGSTMYMAIRYYISQADSSLHSMVVYMSYDGESYEVLTEMQILALSSELPADIFDIPADYQLVSEEEANSIVYGA